MQRKVQSSWLLCYLFFGLELSVWSQEGGDDSGAGEVVTVERVVDRAPKGSQWVRATRGDRVVWKERIRTGELSRAAIEISTGGVLRISELTSFELRPPPSDVPSGKSSINFASGVAYFFSRTEEEADIETPTASLSIRGTEFVVEVGDNGETTVSMVDGEVEMSNELGRISLINGEQGIALNGQAPRKTAVLDFTREIQWFLYYPGIADPNQFVGLQGGWARSLERYRQGDILGALELLPSQPRTEEQFLFSGMVKIASGQVEEAEADLRRGGGGDLVASLRMLIEYVRNPVGDVRHLMETPETPAGLLVRSSVLQASGDLQGALEAADQAVVMAPHLGFAWARKAEMEFSFGRNKKAREAVEQALQLMPRNAQALSLAGYLELGKGCKESGLQYFENALAADPALGNAWLGRGLAYFQFGNKAEALRSMTIAAAVEPNRSFLRSYLGKAFAEVGEPGRAEHELGLAKDFDPYDPTPWLYSALGHQRRNQPNKAIADLQRSVELNDNRHLYRSRWLLDEDRAVKEANLASIFQNAGMDLVAVREATRAVESDYTNASAHLFLANSFDALRDPRRVQLRFETPWFNELLLSNLFSPVGGGPLSQFVSQQEYSKLFQADGVGGSVLGEWRSDDEFLATTTIFGTQNQFEYGLDVSYRGASGTRPNNESDLLEINLQGKWGPTENDTFYFLGRWQEQSTGDVTQTFDNEPLAPLADFEENQRPGLLLAGWNHRWGPGSHTLLVGSRLGFEQTFSDPESEQLLVERSSLAGQLFDVNATQTGLVFTDPVLESERQAAVAAGSIAPGGLLPDGQFLSLTPAFREAIEPFLDSGTINGITNTGGPQNGESFNLVTEREVEIYSADLQQVFETEKNTLLFGGRLQGGKIRARSRLEFNPVAFNTGGFGAPASEDSFTHDFARFNAYLYDYFKPFEELTIVGGVSWDWLRRPDNFRNPPLSPGSTEESRVSGQAAFTYSPGSWLTLRGMFSEGLGGLSFDESVRLEPTQLAGFTQSFRTVISESLVGSVEAPDFQTWGLGVDGVLPTDTWWGVTVQSISQSVQRERGIFTGFVIPQPLVDLAPVFFPDSTSENLDYKELQVTATVNQLLGDEWALGARYRITDSSLLQQQPELGLSSYESALLQELTLSLDWNSSTGLFGRLEGNWYKQDLEGVTDASGAILESDPFIQTNLSLGYRFNDNNAQVSLSALNLFNQDYELSPLNPFLDLPRQRTFVVQCRWNF